MSAITEQQYIVLSVKHTKKRHGAITLWRADDKGYCWLLDSAGRYTESTVRERLDYYNDGGNIAIPLELAIELSAEARYDTCETGICLPHHPSTWARILESLIAPPKHQPEIDLCRVRADKLQRLAIINQAIKAISSYGRRFFYCETTKRLARLEVSDLGHIYFCDDYSGKWIYTAYKGRWRGFSHGGTMRDLVERFAQYVRTGERLPAGIIGLERIWSEGNIWGYAEAELEKVRADCASLECFEPAQAKAA